MKKNKNKWFVFLGNTQENTGGAMQGTVYIIYYTPSINPAGGPNN